MAIPCLKRRLCTLALVLTCDRFSVSQIVPGTMQRTGYLLLLFIKVRERQIKDNVSSE